MEKARKLTRLFYQIYQFYYSLSSTELCSLSCMNKRMQSWHRHLVEKTKHNHIDTDNADGA